MSAKHQQSEVRRAHFSVVWGQPEFVRSGAEVTLESSERVEQPDYG